MTTETDPVCCRCGKPIVGNAWFWVMNTQQARAACPECAKPGEKPFKPKPAEAA